MRSALAIAGVLALGSSGVAVADASVYTLSKTTVTATVNGDGSVKVIEDHTFHFSDTGHGAYQDIPRTAGALVGAVTVGEGSSAYRRSGEAELGVERPAGTFAETDCGGDGPHRVVWYFDAGAGSTRTFRLSYTLKNVITAYDDHAFLNLPVWSRNWVGDLQHLEVSVRLPRPATRKGEVYEAFGRPAGALVPAFDSLGQVVTASADDLGHRRTFTLDLAFPSDRLDLPEEGGAALHKDGSSGSADLETLRSGGKLKDPDKGSACDPPDATAVSGDDPTLLILGGMAVAVALAVLAIDRTLHLLRSRREDNARRGGTRRGSRGRTYYGGGLDIDAYNSGGNGPSGGGAGGDGGGAGGGGGAW